MNDIQASAIPQGRAKKALKTFAICLLIGPPAGALLAMAVFVSITRIWPMLGFADDPFSSTPLINPMMLAVGLMSVPVSYIYGGIPAAVGGALLAGYAYVWGRPPFWVPLAILAIPFFVPSLRAATSGKADMEVIAALALVNLGLVFAAMVCWFVVVKTQFAGPTK